MNSGDLRHRIVIQANVPTRDSSGEEVPAWHDFASPWATAEPLRGQEYLEARKLEADLDIRFRIRFHDGLKPSMRVLFDGRIFDVISVIHVKSNRREIQLMCKELLERSL